MLEEYRKEIDKIDKEIILLLSKRFDIVKKVGIYKKENNIKPLQSKRWEEVLNSRKELGKKYNIDENIIENIWENIHKQSLKIEENI